MNGEEKIGGTIADIIDVNESNWDPLGFSHESEESPWVICWVHSTHDGSKISFFVGVRFSVEGLEVGRWIEGYYRDWSYFGGSRTEEEKEIAKGALIGARTSEAVVMEEPLPRENAMVAVRQFKVVGGYEA